MSVGRTLQVGPHEILRQPGLQSGSVGCFRFWTVGSCVFVAGQLAQELTEVPAPHKCPSASPDDFEPLAAQLTQRMFSETRRFLKQGERIRGVIANGPELIGFGFLSHVVSCLS
mgnify:CR=1 FL=1